MSEPGPEVEALRHSVALSCRLLAYHGIARDIIGHTSARIPGSDEMLIRCRARDEAGLRFTAVDQVRRLAFDGSGPGPGEGYVAPIETPIHSEIYRARPDAGAVVHAHPEAAVLCGLAGVELRPIFGAFDPDAHELAAAGIPVFGRSVLIDSPSLGRELAGALGSKDVCLLRGHGIVAVGATVEQATVRAVKLELLARICWQVALSGRDIPNLPGDEIAAFAARSGGQGVIPGGVQWTWQSYLRLLEEADGDGLAS